MSSGSLLLLLGLLTLWAELTPISTKDRPSCDKAPDTERCKRNVYAFYYNPSARDCLQFVYGGCDGNGKHFRSKALCLFHCHR
uniref:Kunitz-type serine protease inhibitor PILP-1 n=1 Tax=Bungarus multicinctus TaxID=8616 RepID=VKT1L_BUNMU|nr:RecName: Full=Kunitz-type serine protease inhibitor PILP-1; AltName: Full=Protease inhibitor-like protein 1; Flags: Precursor [Bungarus multicinctus]CAP74381.1 protease inhibitor-like protein 1 precursor [Bungarus multicinctus]